MFYLGGPRAVSGLGRSIGKGYCVYREELFEIAAVRASFMSIWTPREI